MLISVYRCSSVAGLPPSKRHGRRAATTELFQLPIPVRGNGPSPRETNVSQPLYAAGRSETVGKMRARGTLPPKDHQNSNPHQKMRSALREFAIRRPVPFTMPPPMRLPVFVRNWAAMMSLLTELEHGTHDDQACDGSKRSLPHGQAHARKPRVLLIARL